MAGGYKIGAIVGSFIGVLFGTFLGRFLYDSFSPRKSYEATDKVQQGYVIPSKLEIKVQDLDQDGKKEVLMQYNGKSYLLKTDVQGNPIIQAYEIKPVEIITK